MAFLPSSSSSFRRAFPTVDEDRRFLRGEEEQQPISLPGSQTAQGETTPVGGGGEEAARPTVSEDFGGRPFFRGTSLTDLSGELGRIGTGVAGLVSEFREAAGPSREFGAQERGQLLTAIRGGAGAGAMGGRRQGESFFRPPTEEETGRARGLIEARFEGPTGLDEEFLTPFEERAQTAAALGAQLGTGRGLIAQQQRAAPGLSRGEARFEAQRRQEAGPEGRGFQRQGFGVGLQGRRTAAEIQRERQEARGFAEQRTGEEQEIARRAREFTGEVRAGIRGGVEGRVQQATEARQALIDAFNRFQQTGDPGELAGVAPQLGGVQIPELQRQAEARAEFDRLFSDTGEFADISNIPPVRLGTSQTGLPARFVTIAGQDFDLQALQTGQAEVPGMTPFEQRRLGRRIMERHGQAVRGFAPETPLTRTTAIGRELALEPGERGRFADIMPLFTQELGITLPERPDIRQFVGFQEGEIPTLENVARASEVEQLNRIAGLLDQPGLLERRERQLPGVTATPEDLQRFELQQQQAQQAIELELARAEAERRRQLGEADRRFRESQEPGFFEGLGRDIGGFFEGLF